MIRIFNEKLNLEIKIDEKSEWIQLTPRDYEDNPHVIIEFKGFDLLRHAEKCADCTKFIDTFGKDSLDWHISYLDKVFRLDTKEIGNRIYPSNEIKVINSEFNSGTKMTLVFHLLRLSKDELKKLLKEAEKLENYENACIIRDLINQ